MHFATRISVLLLFVLGSLSPAALAALSEDYADWAEGPVKYLMTKDETKEWEKIETDADAKHFIDLFWARRDPDLDSPENRFKGQIEDRIRYADREFGYENTRGALSDRGKVLVLLGIPHQAERRGPTETVQSVGATTGQTGMGSDEVRSNVEMWTYDPARLPETFSIRGTRVLFVFYEEKLASNNFVLDRSHREAMMALRTLSKAPEAYFLHPDLDTVPKPVSVPGGSAATAEQLAWLDAGTAPFNDDAIVFLDAGVADASHRPLWLHIELPSAAPALDTLAGRVSDPTGTVLSNFQIAVSPITPEADIYHLTFPVANGPYVVEVVGTAGGEPQVVAKVDNDIEPIPLEGSWMSPIWVGLSAERNESAPLGEAFTFGVGGWHLTPLTADTISKNNRLSYFGFVVHPELDADGNPKIKAKIVLKKDGKRLGSPLRMDLGAAKVTEGLYLYANALDLAPFPAPGEFTLEFTIQDFNAKTKTKKDVTIQLTE